MTKPLTAPAPVVDPADVPADDDPALVEVTEAVVAAAVVAAEVVAVAEPAPQYWILST